MKLRTLFSLIILFLFKSNVKAQLVPGKSISPPHLSVISKEDSLMSEIRSSIYNNIYNPKFWGEYTTPNIYHSESNV
jgi:hypothetical protein